MASRQHQRILALVVRCMKQQGYDLVSCDGQLESLGYDALGIPFAVGRHRPDALGVSADGRYCIGEAKTADDVASRRTREQLADYLTPSASGHAHLILGYPRSADTIVRSVLCELGALDLPQLTLVPVPDELLYA